MKSDTNLLERQIKHREEQVLGILLETALFSFLYRFFFLLALELGVVKGESGEH